MNSPIALIKDILSEPCTFWPNHWGKHDLSPCCRAHDYHYSMILDLTKWQADEYLWYCVRERTGLVWLANLMFWGVYIFGWPAWLGHRVKYQFMWGR
jgi:hypothetical protein